MRDLFGNADFDFVFLKEAHGYGHNDGEQKSEGDHLPNMGFNKLQRLCAVVDAEIGETEIANGARRNDDGYEIKQTDLEGSGAEDRDFHRQRNEGHNGGNKHRGQAPTLKPKMEGGAGFGSDVPHEQDLAAFVGNEKEYKATGERPNDGEKSRYVGFGWFFGGDRD